jgi:hypothetical protein
LIGIKTPTDYSEGGTITLSSALTSGYKLAIVSNVDGTQTTSIKNNSEYYAILHENAFDRLALASLQLMEQSKKSLRGPDAEPASEDSLVLPVASLRSNMYLTFDNNGNVQLINAVKTTALTDWSSFSPAISWDSCTSSGMRRRVGDTLQCRVNIYLNSTPSSTSELEITLPDSLTFDTTKLLVGAGFTQQEICCGVGSIKSFTNPEGTVYYMMSVTPNASVNNTVKIEYASESGSKLVIKPTFPRTLLGQTNIQCEFSLPITGWTYYI